MRRQCSEERERERERTEEKENESVKNNKEEGSEEDAIKEVRNLFEEENDKSPVQDSKDALLNGALCLSPSCNICHDDEIIDKSEEAEEILRGERSEVNEFLIEDASDDHILRDNETNVNTSRVIQKSKNLNSNKLHQRERSRRRPHPQQDRGERGQDFSQHQMVNCTDYKQQI